MAPPEWLQESWSWLVLVICFGVWAWFAWHQWRRMPRGESRDACVAWSIVGDHASVISNDRAKTEARLPEEAKRFLNDDIFDVLGHVLREAPGEVNRDEIPDALRMIREKGESRAGTLRGLAARLVLMTLVATVFMFVGLFWIEGQDLQRGVTTVLKTHVPVVYSFNGIGLFVAFLLMTWAARERDGSLATAEAARRAFRKFRAAYDDQETERMTRALQKVRQEFQEWSSELFDNQFRRIDDLVQEIRGLQDGLNELSQNVVRAVDKDGKHELAAIRTVHTDLKTLATNLDEGLRLLAQPFVQGLPVFEEVRAATQELKLAADGLKGQDIGGKLAELREVVDKQGETIGKIPTMAREGIAESLHGIEATLGDALGNAVSGKMDDLGEQAQGIASRIDAAKDELGNAVSGKMGDLGERAQGIASRIDAARSELGTKLDAAAETLGAHQSQQGEALRALANATTSMRELASRFEEVGNRNGNDGNGVETGHLREIRDALRLLADERNKHATLTGMLINRFARNGR